MPRKNGIQVIEAVRKYIKNANQTHLVQVNEPIFVFLTAYSTQTFQRHIKSLKVEHVYEKPLQIEQLVNIIELSQI